MVQDLESGASQQTPQQKLESSILNAAKNCNGNVSCKQPF